MESQKKGLFIVLDGIDGVGKTTQVKLLRERILASGRKCSIVRSPGSCMEAEDIRKIVLDETYTFDTISEIMLFLAAQRTTYNNVVKPLLDDDQVVLMDRYVFSTYAYQVYSTLGTNSPHINIVMNMIRSFNPMPDLYLILSMTPTEALSRVITRDNDKISKYEKLGKEYMEKAFLGYMQCDSKFGDLTTVRDVRADDSVEVVHNRIVNECKRLIKKL